MGAVAWLSTPCRGTHQRLAPGFGNQVHLIRPTYIALAPTLDPYLHCLASSRGCASSATAAARPQVRPPPTTWRAYLWHWPARHPPDHSACRSFSLLASSRPDWRPPGVSRYNGEATAYSSLRRRAAPLLPRGCHLRAATTRTTATTRPWSEVRLCTCPQARSL